MHRGAALNPYLFSDLGFSGGNYKRDSKCGALVMFAIFADDIVLVAKKKVNDTRREMNRGDFKYLGSYVQRNEEIYERCETYKRLVRFN